MVRSILKASRSIRALFIARGISEIGNWCANIALPLYVYQVTGDASATALLVGCRSLPSLFSMSLVRCPKKFGIGQLQFLRLADLIRAALFLLYFPLNGKWEIMLITLAVASCRAIEIPCFYSVLRASTFDQRDEINNAFGFLQNLMMVVGPLVGGFLVAGIGIRAVLLFNSLTFIASYCLLGAVLISETGVPEEGIAPEGEVKTPKLFFDGRSLAVGFLLIDISSGVAFGSLNSLLPVIVQLEFKSSSLLYGLFQSSLTVGLLAGNLLYGFVIKGREHVKLYCLMTYLALGAYFAFGFLYSFGFSYVLLFAVGVGNSIQDVLLITSLQKLAKDGAESVRLFSIRESFQAFAVVFSTFLVSLCSNIELFPLLFTALSLISFMMVLVFHFRFLRRM